MPRPCLTQLWSLWDGTELRALKLETDASDAVPAGHRIVDGLSNMFDLNVGPFLFQILGDKSAVAMIRFVLAAQ